MTNSSKTSKDTDASEPTDQEGHEAQALDVQPGTDPGDIAEEATQDASEEPSEESETSDLESDNAEAADAPKPDDATEDDTVETEELDADNAELDSETSSETEEADEEPTDDLTGADDEEAQEIDQSADGDVPDETAEGTDEDLAETADSDDLDEDSDEDRGEDVGVPEAAAVAAAAAASAMPSDEGPNPATPEPVVRTETKVVQGSIWPGFFGGVIAALLGFIIGRGDALDNILPEAFQRQEADLTALEAAVETAQSEAAGAVEAAATQSTALDERISSLEASLVALEGAEGPDLSGLSDGLSGIEAGLSTLVARVAALEERPVATENPDAASSESVQELEAALAAQMQEISDLQSRVDAAENLAAEEASQLLAQAALNRVMTAVNVGDGYTAALGDLESVSDVAVPEALRDSADAGVPSLASLQESFPEAARAGLAAARAEVPETDVQGISGFIRRQLNVRSVAPRDGSDPDAILSRAEAALAAGELDAALTEMEALPEVARATMQDWLDAAEARKAAQDAANELADSLNSN
ncbi:MAG: hypothetical protein AAGA74_04215 [Pseudomonadota bacterium]